MNCYIVIGRPDSGLRNKVEKAYDGKYYVIVDDVAWAIATPDITALDVCQKLGISDMTTGTIKPIGSGLVVRFDHYYGVFDPALWQKITAWNAE